MSTYKNEIATIDASVKAVSRGFHNVIPKNSDIKWATEKVFALDIMRKSKDLRAAIPETQQSAILQAGSMGLTLNPSAGECYIIPRKMKRNDPNSQIIAYASPSYRGLIKIAVDSGSILYGAAEVVHMNDEFDYYGKTKPAYHKVDVKKPRGKAIGVYTVARLPSGHEIYSYMDEERILKAKKLSDNPGGLMWTTFWQEGWCKTALRTHQKTWPRSNRLNDAITILNENEGIDLNRGQQESDIEGEATKLITEEQALTIHSKITDSFEDGEKMIGIFKGWLSATYGIDSIDDIPESLYQTVIDKIDESIKHKKDSPDA